MNVFLTIFLSTLTFFRIVIKSFDFITTNRTRNILLDVSLDHRPRLDLGHHQEEVERVAHQVKPGRDEEHGPPRGERRLKMSAHTSDTSV